MLSSGLPQWHHKQVANTMHWGHRAIYGGNAGIVKATAYCGNAGSIETLVLTENGHIYIHILDDTEYWVGGQL